MGGSWGDWIGTTLAYFRIGGASGIRLKNNSGNLQVRNAADDAFVEATASKLNLTGNDLVLNSDAAGSSNDWTATIQRNGSQTEALALVLPPAKGTDGYVLRQKAGTSSGVLELELAAAGTTDSCVKVDTTTLAFGDSSPVSMFTLPANAVIHKIYLIIDTAFNGTPTVSVGVSGTTSKYAGTSNFILTEAAGTVFEVNPGVAAEGGTNALIATYSAGSASAGSARIEVHYSVPA